MTVRHRVFARMWGAAVMAHLAGNWRYGDVWPDFTLLGLLLALAGILGTALVVAPRSWMLLALGVVVPATVVLEAPVLGNHWLLAGFDSVGYLLTWGRWERFEPAARVILLGFYVFAAFAKLNTGYFDPATSCGLFYANQALGEVGVGPFSPGSPIGWVAVWGSALVELSVPLLLLIRRTRVIGVLVAIGFHGLLSLDLAQHFYDFTAVLLPLFVLFLDDSYSERFESVGERIRPSLRRVLVGVVVLVGSVVTMANVLPVSELSLRFLGDGSFLWWIPYLVLVVWAAAASLQPKALNWRLGPVAAALAMLVALNGLTPYLELKTAYGWNMYSNLVTVDGQSNHLLVRSTWPLRDGHEDLVRVVSSDDPGLQAYADEGYLLPWPSFISYTSAHPDVAVTYERAGSVVEVTRAGEDSRLSGPIPWWWRWMPLRAVSASTPDQCQPTFLPAL
ncbi:MAG: hypothetical protein ACRDVD_01650 [Acidimicrobiia bacterium]